MSYQSFATIEAPEFINLQPLDINPLMSKCEIKVLYLGENRNHSYITKEVAEDMAKTLRGAPIVGYYKEEKEDFADHGERMIWDDEGITFECLTKPYGFVAPDAEVWFQKFEEKDDFGNSIVREYLMTTGFLWTEQFPECKCVLEEGKGQSMELDEKTLDGHWSTNTQTGLEFFIINDATFSKLCILGDDVEPCFEGASVTATSFSKVDDNFRKTLYTMMQDLKFALEGGKDMNVEEMANVEEVTAAVETETEAVETPVIETVEEAPVVEEEPAVEETVVEVVPVPDAAAIETEEEPVVVAETDIAEQFAKLKEDYSALEIKYNELVEFKANVENEKKDALINSFYMLSDEDKKDVIENKANYSLDDIEAKLSVICVRKKVNFDLEGPEENDNKTEEHKEVVTYALGEDTKSTVPAWIAAVQKNKNNKED